MNVVTGSARWACRKKQSFLVLVFAAVMCGAAKAEKNPVKAQNTPENKAQDASGSKPADGEIVGDEGVATFDESEGALAFADATGAA